MSEGDSAEVDAKEFEVLEVVVGDGIGEVESVVSGDFFLLNSFELVKALLEVRVVLSHDFLLGKHVISVLEVVGELHEKSLSYFNVNWLLVVFLEGGINSHNEVITNTVDVIVKGLHIMLVLGHVASETTEGIVSISVSLGHKHLFSGS